MVAAPAGLLTASTGRAVHKAAASAVRTGPAPRRSRRPLRSDRGVEWPTGLSTSVTMPDIFIGRDAQGQTPVGLAQAQTDPRDIECPGQTPTWQKCEELATAVLPAVRYRRLTHSALPPPDPGSPVALPGFRLSTPTVDPLPSRPCPLDPVSCPVVPACRRPPRATVSWRRRRRWPPT